MAGIEDDGMDLLPAVRKRAAGGSGAAAPGAPPLRTRFTESSSAQALWKGAKPAAATLNAWMNFRRSTLFMVCPECRSRPNRDSPRMVKALPG